MNKKPFHEVILEELETAVTKVCEFSSKSQKGYPKTPKGKVSETIVKHELQEDCVLLVKLLAKSHIPPKMVGGIKKKVSILLSKLRPVQKSDPAYREQGDVVIATLENYFNQISE